MEDFQTLIVKIADILEKFNIPYAITGGYAVSVWGRPRATFDVDVIVELKPPDIPTLARALRAISKASYADEESMREAIQRNGEFNFIHGSSGIKFDFFVVGRDEFSKAKIANKRPQRIGGKNIYFISPEDLILSKLIWFREGQSARQLEDIQSILKIHKKLDMKYLKLWAAKLDVADELDAVNKVANRK